MWCWTYPCRPDARGGGLWFRRKGWRCALAYECEDQPRGRARYPRLTASPGHATARSGLAGRQRVATLHQFRTLVVQRFLQHLSNGFCLRDDVLAPGGFLPRQLAPACGRRTVLNSVEEQLCLDDAETDMLGKA